MLHVRWHQPAHAAFLTIGLGAFSEGTDAPNRNSFCIEWRAEGMRLTDDPRVASVEAWIKHG